MEMKHKVIKKGFPRIIQTWNNGTKVYRVDCRKEGLLKAEEKNIDKTRKSIKDIEKKMTPSQIAEAQKLAREWVKEH